MSEIIFVAEIGSTHKGSPALAYELIRQFSEANADVIKFQFGWNEETQKAMGLEYNPIRYVDPWAEDLKKWCDYFGVELMASIWSMEGLHTAQDVGMERYKVAHQLWGKNPGLADTICNQPHEVFASNGGFEYPSVHAIYAEESYPTYPDGLTPPKEYGEEISSYYGYSDHSHGIAPCLLAVARGALYIEKHVCLSKDDLTVRDTPFAADPDEFAEMVRLGREMRRLLDAGV